jgi:hypothetical protein
MVRRSRKTRSSTVRVDFTGIEGKRVVVPEGDYRFAVKEITQKQGDKADYFEWQLSIVGGDHDGATVYYNTSLAPQALWNLRSLLEALGVEVPDGPTDLDLEEMVSLEMEGTIEHEKYEGRPTARLVDFWEVAEEEPAPKKGRGRKAAAEEEEAPKRRGRKAKVEEDDEEEEEAPKRRSRRSKAAADEDEEEEAPKRRGRGKAAKKEVLDQDAINDMSQEELEDLIEEHELDVDISIFKTLRKMRAAVIDAADEAALLNGD